MNDKDVLTRAYDLYDRANKAYQIARANREEAERCLSVIHAQMDAQSRKANRIAIEERSWDWRRMEAALVHKRLMDLVERRHKTTQGPIDPR